MLPLSLSPFLSLSLPRLPPSLSLCPPFPFFLCLSLFPLTPISGALAECDASAGPPQVELKVTHGSLLALTATVSEQREPIATGGRRRLSVKGLFESLDTSSNGFISRQQLAEAVKQ